MKENMLDCVCSCFCLGQSSFQEIDMEMIGRVWCVISSVRLHEERLEWEKPCCPKFTNELLGIDMNCDSDLHSALLYAVPNTISHLKVLFTSEFAIYCATCDRSVLFWAQENPHFMAEF
jgi:hypothetical protein